MMRNNNLESKLTLINLDNKIELIYNTQVICLFLSHLKLQLIYSVLVRTDIKTIKLSIENYKKKENKFKIWYDSIFTDIHSLLVNLGFPNWYISYFIAVLNCLVQHDKNNHLNNTKEQLNEQLKIETLTLVYKYTEIDAKLATITEKQFHILNILKRDTLDLSTISDCFRNIIIDNYFQPFKQVHLDFTLKIPQILSQKEVEERNKCNILFPEHPFDELWPFKEKKNFAESIQHLFLIRKEENL